MIDGELVRFEQNPQDAEILGNIFRLVHTIKGTCGFLGLPRLESVAHAGENVLGKFRDGVLPVVLTGMGSDGSRGGKVLADGGATVIAQDEASSVVWGMPGAAATSGICTAVVPLKSVAGYINDFVAKGMP